MMVIDASAMVKWYLPEPGSEHIQSVLQENIHFAAPDLIRLEVAAAITRRARNQQLAGEHAAELCALWLQAERLPAITLIPMETILPEAIKIALRIHHPLQDCLYLAVAMRFRAPLLTADKAFYRRALPDYSGMQLLDASLH